MTTEIRSPRRGPGLALLALTVLLVASPFFLAADPPPVDQDETAAESTIDENSPLRTQRAAVALASLEERSRSVNDLLQDAARAYRKAAIERSAAQQEYSESVDRLDREVVRVRDLTRERLDLLSQDVLRARLRLQQLIEESERRLEDFRRLMVEREQLSKRIADLRAVLPETQAPLSGVWEVSWLPNAVTGTFYLEQNGTLVTGQYKLGSLGSGSLQGTFVGGKLYLQRIDATRGRDAELEGVLDADGARIRGTWQNFEMVQGGTPRGQWVARRAR